MHSLDELIEFARLSRASELLIMAGDIPAMRVSENYWLRLPSPRFTPADMEKLVKSLIAEGKWDELQEKRELECEHHPTPGSAVPCNIHFQRGTMVVLVRLQPTFQTPAYPEAILT